MSSQKRATFVISASPAKARLSSARCAASAWPAPHASAMITGIRPRSAAWGAVGSIPIPVAIPAMAIAEMPQSRSAKLSGVPSNADLASLSKMASLGNGASSGTMAKPGESRRNHGWTSAGSSTRCQVACENFPPAKRCWSGSPGRCWRPELVAGRNLFRH